MINQAPPPASILVLIAVVHLSRAVTLAYSTRNANPILELYMHDILGVTSPTPRPGNIHNGHISFARPLRFDLPKSGYPTGPTFMMTSNGHAPIGSVGHGLGFGAITVINDVLTLGPNLGTETIGKAQGVYVTSSVNGSTQLMAFTAMIEGGDHGDTLNFFGVYERGTDVSRLSVIGGTGKFRNACGFAEIRRLFPSDRLAVDVGGVEILLRISVHLTY